MPPYYQDNDVTLHHGDCREVLPTLPAASVDAVVCDPPYPCVEREYGRWTEDEWHALMRGVVPELRRVLTPTGSAVLILQPNSDGWGRLRPWLWDFLAWASREWNVVQDAWWWNIAAMPGETGGLLRPSVKMCVWLGDRDCYRNQDGYLCPPGGTVLDPFCGSGTVLRAAKQLGRRGIGVEVVEDYCRAAVGTLGQQMLPLAV